MSGQGLGEGPLENVSRDRRRHAEHPAEVRPAAGRPRAAPRPAAPAPDQQQGDPAGDPGTGRAGRNRRPAPAADRRLRRHRGTRRRGVLPDGADRRVQRGRATAGAARQQPRNSARDGPVDGGLAGRGSAPSTTSRSGWPTSASPTDSWNVKCRAGFRSSIPIRALDDYPGPDIRDVAGVATWLREHQPRTGSRASCTATITPPT